MSYSNDIFWVHADPPPGLAIVLRPRGNDWLEDELRRMQAHGMDTLVSMLEAHEVAELGLEEEGKLASSLGMAYVTFPIPDRTLPPNFPSFQRFAAHLAAQLRAGRRIGIHCRASIGRATMTAACTLVHLGWSTNDSLQAIEAARGCPVPDTPEQRQWILDYKAVQ